MPSITQLLPSAALEKRFNDSPAARRYAGSIDMTPTWQGVMPMLLAAVRDGTPKGRHEASAEINRLAGLADRANVTLAQQDKQLGEFATVLQEICRERVPLREQDKAGEPKLANGYSLGFGALNVLADYLGSDPVAVADQLALGRSPVLFAQVKQEIEGARFTVAPDTLTMPDRTHEGFIVKHKDVPIGFLARDAAPVGFVPLFTEDATPNSPVIGGPLRTISSVNDIPSVMETLTSAQRFINHAGESNDQPLPEHGRSATKAAKR